MPRILIAAGGTAGHVVPALAVAEELRSEGAEVAFAGTRARAEAVLVPAAGYELFHLSVSGLHRRNPVRAALAAAQAGVAVARSLGLLRRLRPDAVLCGGGYIAGPVGLAAALRGVPLVLTESDSRLGLANRLLARFARRVCLAFPIAGREGPRYVLTGRPVPRAVLDADRERARERLGIETGAACLLVFGGSLGARSINECALEAFGDRPPAVRGEPAVVVHVSGRRDHPALAERLRELGSPPHYRLFDYLDSMADPLAASDLVLARAGGSVLELAAAGRPAVLVPYPHATGAHQQQNARWMADGGAAAVIDDVALAPGLLRETVEELLGDRGRLRAMSEAARSLARPDAARRIADELLAAASTNRGPAGRRPWEGRRLHFVGIGGAGMSGLALVARSLGAEVSGCDRAEGPYTELLGEAGILYEIGHSPAHATSGPELVVSTAIPQELPEVAAARERGAPVLHRGELLAEAAGLRRSIAVSGTHGKTTTAAMTAHALDACGADSGFLVGGELLIGGGPAATASWGAGEWLVVEADESDRSFLQLSPEIAIVTNVELDHHTTYGSTVELEGAFRAFLERLPEAGAAVVWDRPALRRLVPAGRRVATYDLEDDDNRVGGGPAPELAAHAVRATGARMRFELLRGGESVCDVELPVAGRHNVLNALAALTAVELAGFDLERAARSLAGFRPAARRFEPKGSGGGIAVYDDYAHHPSEIAATLDAARALEPARLLAVFQPHLYSRTLHLHRELGRELARADVAIVLDVYAARELPDGPFAGVSGKLVADACAEHAAGRPVWWLPTQDEAETALVHQMRAGDVIVTLGAGDVDRLAERLAARLDGTPAR